MFPVLFVLLLLLMYSAAADTIAAVVDSVGAVAACVSALVVGVFSADDAAVVDAAFVGVQLFLMLPLLVLLLFVALLYN
jgi:hypothetical protein